MKYSAKTFPTFKVNNNFTKYFKISYIEFCYIWMKNGHKYFSVGTFN